MMDGILSLAKDQAVEKVEAAARHFVEVVHHPQLGFTYRDCIY
jgi:hypothetical protein